MKPAILALFFFAVLLRAFFNPFFNRFFLTFVDLWLLSELLPLIFHLLRGLENDLEVERFHKGC